MSEKSQWFAYRELTDEERELGRKLWQMELEMTEEAGYREGYEKAYKEAYEKAFREAYEKAFREAYEKAVGEAFEEACEEGEATERKGQRAEPILRILSARGLTLTAEDRERLMACRDISVLFALLLRASTLQPGEDLFEGQPDEPSQV